MTTLSPFSIPAGWAIVSAMANRLNFLALVPPKTPNWCLAAPDGYCRNAAPQLTPPVFDKPVAALWDALLAVVAAEPRVTIHEQAKADGYLDFTQVSLLFRFPDRVTIQIVPEGHNRSTLAIFSRSKYGRSDLGVNAKRVKRLLAALARV